MHDLPMSLPILICMHESTSSIDSQDPMRVIP